MPEETTIKKIKRSEFATFINTTPGTTATYARINKSVSQWVHKARTNGTESPTVTNTSISRYAKNIGAGVMITGYKTSEITNWGNSYFFANGTNIKVWEGA